MTPNPSCDQDVTDVSARLMQREINLACPRCGQLTTEPRHTVTGVCPTHGVQHVIALDLRSHEPPRNSGEGTAVKGPMPLEGKGDALERA